MGSNSFETCEQLIESWFMVFGFPFYCLFVLKNNLTIQWNPSNNLNFGFSAFSLAFCCRVRGVGLGAPSLRPWLLFWVTIEFFPQGATVHLEPSYPGCSTKWGAKAVDLVVLFP